MSKDAVDADTIRNTITKLGRYDFRKVVSLLLREVFRLNAISVDGPGDGGADWLIFKDSGGTSTVAYQDTVQATNWEAKAKQDARKAVEQFGATRYFFLTPKSHSSLTLRKLESELTSELKIPATCLSAQEIAQFIVEAKLVREFLDCINAPLAAGVAKRPDKREILLHAYSTLSADRFNHQNEVYDDSLLITSRSEGPLNRGDLVAKTIEFLNCSTEKTAALAKRIDSLLSRRLLRQTTDKRVAIDVAAAQELENSERLYLKDFGALAEAQAALMKERFAIEWSSEDAEHVSVFIARLFVKNQLDCITDAGATVSASGLLKSIGDPLQDIRDYLKRTGLHPSRVSTVLAELTAQAKDFPIVKKLSRAAVYVSLEGADPVSSAKAIGAPRWSDVKVLLDASAAIPMLCARLYQPVRSHFFNPSAEAAKRFQGVGANLCISWNYIQECASHLIRALKYQDVTQFFESELGYSQNAYVANYFLLKQQGAKVPPSLGEYLATFSHALARRHASWATWVRNVMPDIQHLLVEYGVAFESLAHPPDAIKREFQIEYTYTLDQINRRKPAFLIEHDVDSLAHVKRQVSERGEHWILLTWDRAMITVGRKLVDGAWVISPETACDFIQPYMQLSEGSLCSLSHRIARGVERQHGLSAQIIDKVIAFAADELLDWQFREEFRKFKDGVLDRVDFESPNYAQWIDSETDRFLESMGVDLGKAASELPEVDD